MATQTLTPDSISSSSNLTNATTAALAAQDANWASVVDNASGTSLVANFPTPTPTLNGTQTIIVQVRKNATGGASPSFFFTVMNAGATILTSPTFTVSSTTGEIFQAQFDASALSIDPTGTNFTVILTGNATGGKPADRRSVGFGYLAWVTNYTTPVPGGKPKVRLSGSWVTKPMKVRLAGQWVEKPLKVYVNGQWVLA